MARDTNIGAPTPVILMDGSGNAVVPTGGTITATGANTIASGQVSVANTSTSIAAARATRRAIAVINHGTTDVFVGVTGLTTGNGALLKGVAGSSITLYTSAAVFGIVASGTQTVSFIEEYDS